MNKVTVHLNMSDTQWGHVVDKAAHLGMTPEEYITGLALGDVNDIEWGSRLYS